MALGILTIHLHLPGCRSLKEKRSRLKPLLHRLRREFNVSVAEMGRQDEWQSAVIACAWLSSDRRHAEHSLQRIPHWIETYWPDVTVLDDQIELW